MNSSVMLMPWCRFSDLRLKSPAGFADLEEFLDLRVVDVEIAGGRAAAQRALLIARVSESITRMNGMMPEVCPFWPTFSPIERTSPQ
jgi:hypothetical protein